MIDTKPHFVLDGLAGWRAADLQNAMLANGGDSLTLQQLPGSIRPLVDPQGSFGGLQAAIGVAVDSENRVYVLDGQTCLLKRFDRCQQKFVTLPCIGGCGTEPRQLSSPHGLAISCCNNIYIADTGNYRVQILSIKGLALRNIWGPFKVEQTAAGISISLAVPTVTFANSAPDCSGTVVFPSGTWQPWDVVVSSRNWTYVSDYANGLIHVFDPHGCWTTAYTGAGPSSPQLVKPTRMALGRDGRIYVLQESQNYVVVLNPDGTFQGTVSQPADVVGQFCPVAVAVEVNGNLCLSDCVTRKFYFYQPDGDGGWCPTPCPSCTGTVASSLIFDLSGNAVFADGAQRVCQLAPQGTYPTSGYYFSYPLDSKIYRCLWHRIVLRGCVPPGTSVHVDTFTAESDKPIDEIESLPESRWATAQIDTDTQSCEWDCLSLSPPGRYFWLRLILEGDGSATPVLEKVKVYYPRASSLQYLPAVYREDSISADLTARFLSIFDTLRNLTSSQITDIARYFDPKATPANPPNVAGNDFLSWLAGWLGLSLQNNWPVRKRRELVRQAHKLFDLRGTPEGLKLMIELYTGFKPRILELFRLRRWLVVDSAKLGDQSAVLGKDIMKRLQVGENSKTGSFQLIDYGNPSLDFFNSYAYQFIVIVPRWPGASDTDQMVLQQIIDMAKPAHTQAQLRWDEPRFRIGLQSFVGVDTVLAKYPVGVIEGQGSLGYDTVLGSPEESTKRPSSSVGRSSRIGCNTVLN
jgi:phage tail-like protein